MQKLTDILEQAKQQIAAAADLAALDTVRVKCLGKQGELTEILKGLGKLPPEERPKVGEAVNIAKQELQGLINDKKSAFEREILNAKLAGETIDVTLPGRLSNVGTLHPVSKVRARVEEYFKHRGFEIVDGPEIEDEYYNFEALNIPAHHPARAMHDTFYFADGLVLRTHTSNVQIRYMEDNPPPLRMVSLGRVYRCDSDVTHTPMFHQAELLVINETANFAELKGLIVDFMQFFFEQDLQMRFRPSYFPFTEPSAEADIQCVICQAEDPNCRVCGGSGWLEILGCGMVHPNVLKAVGVDSEKYRGYAFGLGLDRLAMLRYGINDLRLFFESDVRFLKQF
ncbi:MAG: phenylalanine--tRNA ligase subunit alpha [Legionellales bacterium]|nr:phenylalanine--tRNA ligase subunit alpha [Legionellales bacterium]|tara:strand:- start:11437 stop:12456 length:1020 start_codon:yes stop_codon:yes gene_type:complete